jgi:hypothetical protein
MFVRGEIADIKLANFAKFAENEKLFQPILPKNIHV